MPTHVALLRGINLGPHKRVAMPALREVVESLGHTDVATYIQSGNVVFTAAGATGLADGLEQAIAEQLGVTCRVVVLTREELAATVADNPYPQQDDHKRLHAIFLTGPPGAEAEKRLEEVRAKAAVKGGGKDEATIVGRTLYLHTPDGFGRSELAKLLSRPGGATEGTARNWTTVRTLLAMCEGKTREPAADVEHEACEIPDRRDRPERGIQVDRGMPGGGGGRESNPPDRDPRPRRF